jgi:hypothetical protein
MISIVEEKYERISSMMNERLRRRWAACEAMALGRGGISAVSEATGISRTTIRRAIREIQSDLPKLADELAPERIRKPGGGRRSIVDEYPDLLADLQNLLESNTRGDPMCSLLWTSKSTRKLARELQDLGYEISHVTVANLLEQLDYSLQANRKTREGNQHPDRNAQFEYLNKKIHSFKRRKQPVISVDTKKRELVGDFKNGGREWSEKGKPEEVRTHDFRDKELGVAIPYGIYDLTKNNGWVSVGISRDTAEFASATIRRWWDRMGKYSYPEATELLITSDSGGSNSSRARLWKLCIQQLADQLGLKITVCHFPPSTSKWNKIEHRMFCHITENWRARPLVSQAVVVNLIANTTTRGGLKIKSAIDNAEYKIGIKVTDEQFETINITRHKFHGDWNYSIAPNS